MRTTRGHSLTELLFATALFGGLLAVALPAFAGLVESTRANAVAHRLHAELAMAREAALFGRRPVTFCRSTNQVDCAPVGAWSEGTMTFEDPNRNDRRDSGERLIRATRKIDFQGLHLIDHSIRRHIRFRPDGRSAGTNVTLRLCAKDLEPLRLVIINTGGRVRMTGAPRGTARCGTDATPW